MGTTNSTSMRVAICLPDRTELEALFLQKYGAPEIVGWSPRRRFRYGYYLPSDYYEALVSRLVFPKCRWLDVGGGHAIFPENEPRARELVEAAGNVVAVDPSENVLKNRLVHQRVQGYLEDYVTDELFDLATMRMVVEHVSRPTEYLHALSKLMTPGGLAIVLTVNRWSPLSLLSALLPFGMHHGLKSLFWGGEEEDTFPVEYRMNTRAQLRRLFNAAGFEELTFAKLDDLSLFGNFRCLNLIELWSWRLITCLGFRYPENCLLGVYRRLPNSASG